MNSVIPKYVKKMNLYNMLQDFRHILILDTRQQFPQCYIRDSTSIFKQLPKSQLLQLFNYADKKNVEKQKKYNLKKIRRVVIINQIKMDLNNAYIKNIQSFINQDPEFKDYKLYVLQNPFQQFYTKYPFLCYSKKLFEENEGKIGEDSRSVSIKMKQNDNMLLYSFAKFPTQIVEDILFLGNIYNSNSEKQIKDLKIKSLIDLVSYNKEQIVPTFKKNYNYHHIPLENQFSIQIKFDEINEFIQNLITKKQYPILIYCKNGQSFAPGFCIAYLMYKYKNKCDIASLKVFQATSNVQICKWLYTQLLLYTPKIVN